MKKTTYIVAGRQPWNHLHFKEELRGLAGEWYFAATSEELNTLVTELSNLRYIFFMHWSEKVPTQFTTELECVCFHMTDVPFGRGGSPLQNLLAQGITETKMTALRMTDDFDAGDVYMKRDFSLKSGSAHVLYQQASRLSCDMIKEIATEEPTAEPQCGEVTIFKRRKPQQSEMTANIKSLEELHNHIRMLDAPGYPHAYIDLGEYRIHFTSSALEGDQLSATVSIQKNTK